MTPTILPHGQGVKVQFDEGETFESTDGRPLTPEQAEEAVRRWEAWREETNRRSV